MALPAWLESCRQWVLRPPGTTVQLRPLQEKVQRAAERRRELEQLGDAALNARARRSRADRDEVEFAAAARECARRALGLRPYDEQLTGALALAQGRVVQMATGEGKTVTAAIAAAALSADGPVHVLTVNDYLAGRDAQWMRPLYERLGVSVGWITELSTRQERREAYACDVTYVSVNEAGFDFLRDGLCTDLAHRVQQPLGAVIVDEADSILVDEARIPLVLAGATLTGQNLAQRMAELVRQLRHDEHYVLADENRVVHLTPEGAALLERALGGIHLYAAENLDVLTAVNLALHAEALLTRDVDYIVRDGRVELVDSFRGRVAQRRRWPDGLHAAVEAKESLTSTGGGTILATITLQAFVNQYSRVAGMTGTALPVGDQLLEFYGLEVVVLPPHRPRIRVDEPDRVYATSEQRDTAVLAQVATTHATGQPVLLATPSIAESEALGARLRDAGIDCTVLNAKNDAMEAAIIAEAGTLGAVIVSTQMTGRGVDIRLGGSDQHDHARVAATGGLYVIGVGRHDSSRVDDQLRGRSGRHGDPGRSVFFVSMQDDLITTFGPEKLPRLEPASDGRLDEPAALRAVADAQRIAEQVNLEIHRNTWRYHYLLEQHRATVAALREELLTGDRADRMMAQHRPADHARLVRAHGRDRVASAAQAIVLYHLDMAWADHLRDMGDLRESIHLHAFANLDPLDEFHRAAIPAFRQLIPDVELRSAETFAGLDLSDPDWTPADLGLERPSATWTYIVNDSPFGVDLERFFAGVIGLLRAGWQAA
ncbi:preprotein translocase subunit SecA [Actinoplanes octamycinicus]|uniref:Protein translocase subunit SecA n=1 Tax=Actinoplanes octamycinicus TaxID=135948 RepID=A0A7W7H0J3_9ACTN|nr:accessory Sec system translocase SecA2 [Actinoplanes octamycinicus]MBB4741699.1 preprotein translocase subunit SecA [Actinoplanes octamycinicus]GIE57252.1 protein translocase subunit SecA 2 [Actinoplanes octamycinicus]